MKYIYICGPITGLPNNNEQTFKNAFAELLKVGIYGHNPLSYTNATMTWNACMKAVLPYLLNSDGVALLPGWEDSRGCRLEVLLAGELDIDCRPLEEWL